MKGVAPTKLCRLQAAKYGVDQRTAERWLQHARKLLDPATQESAQQKVAFHEHQAKVDLEWINTQLNNGIAMSFEDRIALINTKLKLLTHLARINGLERIEFIHRDEGQALESGPKLLKKVREIDSEVVEEDGYGS